MSNTPLAGAEIDRLIAEKAMGWTEYNLFEDEPELPASIHYRETHWAANVGEGGCDDSHVFKPSTQIAHAWEVVEKMHALGWDLILVQQRDGDWDASFFGHAQTYGVLENTAPLAICLAALNAMAQPVMPDNVRF